MQGKRLAIVYSRVPIEDGGVGTFLFIGGWNISP